MVDLLSGSSLSISSFFAYVGGYGMYGDTSDCGSTDSQADLVGSRFNTETVYIGQSLVKGLISQNPASLQPKQGCPLWIG